MPVLKAEHEILIDLRSPKTRLAIWDEARRFVAEVFPTEHTIKLAGTSHVRAARVESLANLALLSGTPRKPKNPSVRRFVRLNFSTGGNFERLHRVIPTLLAASAKP